MLALSNLAYWVTTKLLIKVQHTSRQRLTNIFGEQPRFVRKRVGEVEVQVPFEAVQTGDIVVVHAGETIPIDGLIIDGLASIAQHMLTGEAQPAEKERGDLVFAATVVLSGTIDVRVEKTGGDTNVASITDMLYHTANYTSSLELKGKVIADKTALPVLALSAATLPLLGPTAALCMLGCHPGQGMNVLAPLSLLSFLRVAAEQHILVKDGRALESLQDVDTLVFDKTGTLTHDQPQVAAVDTCGRYGADELLRYAAAAEFHQTHPLARAILQESRHRQLTLPSIDEAIYEVGYGIKVAIDAHLIRVGSRRFMEKEGFAIPAGLSARQADGHEQGHTRVYVAIDETVEGAIEMRPTIRPEVKGIIDRLRQRGLDIYILSGDHEQPTKQLAHQLGLDHYFAETLPEHKADLIEQLQQAGRSVCFIGDGINDSIALKKAHVSISLSGASAVAVDAADIIFVDGSLSPLPYLFELSEAVDTNMKGNFLTLMAPAPLVFFGVSFWEFRVFWVFIVRFLSSIASIAHAISPAIKSRLELDRTPP
jgi:Cu2+-exporting ATPase